MTPNVTPGGLSGQPSQGSCKRKNITIIDVKDSKSIRKARLTSTLAAPDKTDQLDTSQSGECIA